MTSPFGLLFCVVAVSARFFNNEDKTNSNELIVQTQFSRIKGRWNAKYATVREFVGIPFAESTGGSNRFRPAKPIYSFSSVVAIDATKDPKPCPQVEFGIFTDENCLKLSVYTPSTPRISSRRLPVVFWVCGGAFSIGGAWTNGLYDGSRIVSETDVVFVTFNYRVGAFGFLATAGKDGIKGNAGITDQIAAFQWVKNNIESFGGDSENITIQGQSAGAMSVMILLQNAAVSQYVKRAIIMSCPFGLRFKTLQEAENVGSLFAKRCGCDPEDTDCLQRLSVGTILRNQKLINNFFNDNSRVLSDFLRYSPTLDNLLVKSQTSDWINGIVQFPNIPIVLGTVEDEAMLIHAILSPFSFIHGLPISLFSALGYKRIIHHVFKEKADGILHRYPSVLSTKCNWFTFLSIITHYIFTAPTRQFAVNASKCNSSIHLYRWKYPGKYLNFGVCSEKACHAVELPIIFGTLPSLSKSNIFLHEADNDNFQVLFQCSNSKDTDSVYSDWKDYIDDNAIQEKENHLTLNEPNHKNVQTSESLHANSQLEKTIENYQGVERDTVEPCDEISNSFDSLLSHDSSLLSDVAKSYETNTDYVSFSLNSKSSINPSKTNVIFSFFGRALRIFKTCIAKCAVLIEYFGFYPYLSAKDLLLHRTFRDLLNSFVNSGDTFNQEWPSLETEQYLVFLEEPYQNNKVTSTSSMTDDLKEICEFWNDLNVYGDY